MAGRKPLYSTAAEMPVTCSLRVPRSLYDETQQYLNQYRLSLTEFLLDAIRLRLDTPADPRDIKVSDNGNTIVLQKLQGMVDAAVEAALAKLEQKAPPVRRDTIQPARDDIQYYDNNTVIQEKDTAPLDAPEAVDAQIAQHITRLEDRIHEIQHDDNNTVIHEPSLEAAVIPQGNIRHYDNTVLQEGTAQVSDAEGTPGQTAVPPFDASTRYLGPLCPRGHDWARTGESLRNKKSNCCLECNKEDKRAKRQQPAA